jgi:hypothetical protein
MSCSFHLDHYENCIKLAKQKGYVFMTMMDYNADRLHASEKVILLRHDIDAELDSVLPMAEVEIKNGVVATYFLRLHSRFFNPFSLKSYAVLRRLKLYGSEVGLHYDPEFARVFNLPLAEHVKECAHIFREITKQRVFGASAHNPSEGSYEVSEKLLHPLGVRYVAFSDLFTKEMKYISDSCGRWREGCMCNFIQKVVPKLHINTHSVFWSRTNTTEREILGDVL